jgi:hypothetical protein
MMRSTWVYRGGERQQVGSGRQDEAAESEFLSAESRRLSAEILSNQSTLS